MLVPTSGVGVLLGVGALLQGLEAGSIGLAGRVAIRNGFQSVQAGSLLLKIAVVVAQPQASEQAQVQDASNSTDR